MGLTRSRFFCYNIYFRRYFGNKRVTDKRAKNGLKSRYNSCSFAGIANLLAEKGIDTED
jgi:hypothetical protein